MIPNPRKSSTLLPDAGRRGFLALAGVVGCGTAAWALGQAGGGKREGRLAAGGPRERDHAAWSDDDRLNFALNLAYLGAAFHGHAAGGTELPADMRTGVGEPGPAINGRRVPFADPLLGRYAVELAEDKAAQVAALRQLLGERAAAHPRIDLLAQPVPPLPGLAPGSAFIDAEGRLDSFAGDQPYLLGAFLVENGVAAVARVLLADATGAAAQAALTDMLGQAIYCGGLLRTLLADSAAAAVPPGRALAAACALQALLDGSDLIGGGDTVYLTDAAGNAVPFVRRPAQILQTYYATPAGRGGFFPQGMNAVAV